MTRGLTGAITTEIAGQVVRPVSFIEMEFDSETRYVWSGVGDISWGGHTWSGVGELLAISPAAEVSDVSSMGFSVALSGVIPEYVALILQHLQQGKRCKWYLGFLDATGAVIADPITGFSGYIDYAEFDIGPADAVVTVTCESRLVDLTKVFVRRYTKEDQQIDYPDDTGFNWVNAIQSQTINWGGQAVARTRPALSAPTAAGYGGDDGNAGGPGPSGGDGGGGGSSGDSGGPANGE